ncbi:Receptor-like protein [Actinidia chinensis var. chinensis]|uniref:Receptor-like protein n=1 Tax=Actinidia chinensis var. chinensis TaxID=1590841 RepID=A0A2R6P2M3_ACTCC|nr:Receptor-like protein [Actinidia chinensis var. chinensis]
MGKVLISLFQFLFYFLQYHLASSSISASSFSPPPHNLCPHDMRFALLQFKHTFAINSYASSRCDYYGSPSYPKTMSWNESATDCCQWDGVTCDELTGHVIGLDLSCGHLYGTFDANSSLFRLSHLQRLNLAYNHFNYSRIPYAFGSFANLTHLNLSYSRFSGPIPSKISFLSKLISLDLSSFRDYFILELHHFRMLLKNMTQVQELVLNGVNISSVLPDSLTNLSSLTNLDLGWTRLQGNIPNNIFHLPKLQRLILRDNGVLRGNLQKVNWSSSSSLSYVDLSHMSLSGDLPHSVGYLKSLNHLDLSSTSLSGELPHSIGYLKSLNYLNFSSTSLSGELPHSIGYLKSLNYLNFSSTSLSGELPHSIGYLKSLKVLDLRNCRFSGSIPKWIGNLTRINYLVLSRNAFTGPIPSAIGELQNLKYLLLSDNKLIGTIPSGLLNLPSLLFLDLSGNQFTGQINEFQHKSTLKVIDLSRNKLHGPIPHSVSKLSNLLELRLSSNNLSGVVELKMFSNLKFLHGVDLSNTNLSVNTESNINSTFPNIMSFLMSSCKIDEFPRFLRTLVNLVELDLSNNKIHGTVPEWVTGKASLTYLNLSHNFLTSIERLPLGEKLDVLDLHSNLLQGPLPIPPPSTWYFFISQNKLSGEIPSSICNAKSFEILDLSHNNFSNAIPPCLGNFSQSLSILDLKSNAFHGAIPLTFGKYCNLQNLDLNGNQFEGPLPPSLSNCKFLELLNLGNNKINDTFPYWLGTLPELQVLVLRSNRFHGPIDSSKGKFPFPKLRIVDLSHNNFIGHLPGRYFKNFKAMKNKTMPNEKYMGAEYYQDSVAVTMKGIEIEMLSILTVFTTIDLSSNKFSGGIPDVIGELIALNVLNLSHNSLTGRIPSHFGDLAMLESLDLSSNQLVGKIPNQLTSLTFLEVLNLSWNHLDGPIPKGKQFATFENGSYAGNSGLCGFPLSRECGDNQAQVLSRVVCQQEDDSDFASGFTWKVVVMGYGCGMALGLFVGYFMFLTGRPKFFVRIVENEVRETAKRLKRTHYRRVGRRN